MRLNNMPVIGVLPRHNWIIRHDHKISVGELEDKSNREVAFPISFPYHDGLHTDL